MTDREALFFCYGVIKLKAIDEEVFTPVVEIIEEHIFPPIVNCEIKNEGRFTESLKNGFLVKDNE